MMADTDGKIDPTVRPLDSKERRRQTNPKTKKYKDSTTPDWEIERLKRASLEWRAHVAYMLARPDLDPLERRAWEWYVQDLLGSSGPIREKK